MNMNVTKLEIFFIIVTQFIVFKGWSQTEIDTERKKIGGISLKDENQSVLEEVILGVYYQFTYRIKEDVLLETKSDTMLLALGATQSVFLDPIYKERFDNNRKSRIARSKKTKLIENRYDNIDAITELININSDYKEDDTGEPVQIYKKRDTHIVSSVFNSYTDNIRCDQKMEQMLHWRIFEDTIEILGYSCRKAEINYSGRNYTAWFTNEISINDGPWKFWGLPGLILKVTDDDGLFEWIGVGIEYLNADIVIDIAKYEHPNLSQFNKFVDKATSTMIVSFYNNDVLYFSNKNKPYKKIPIEILGKK